MTNEDEVCKAAMLFYEGLMDMEEGRGIERVKQAWEHSDRVTAGHPSGEWSQGWSEIVVGFELFAALGAPGRGGSKVSSMKAYVYGDFAYTTCIFTVSPVFGGEALACTNVLRKVEGDWKIIHHHADKSRSMETASENVIRQS